MRTRGSNHNGVHDCFDHEFFEKKWRRYQVFCCGNGWARLTTGGKWVWTENRPMIFNDLIWRTTSKQMSIFSIVAINGSTVGCIPFTYTMWSVTVSTDRWEICGSEKTCSIQNEIEGNHKLENCWVWKAEKYRIIKWFCRMLQRVQLHCYFLRY